jgi:DNA-binding NarL/FixJ family response regulator
MACQAPAGFFPQRGGILWPILRRMIVAFVDDLMLLSRVREAARALDVEVRGMRRVPDLVEACRHSPTVVLIDLDSARLPSSEAISVLKTDPVLARIPIVGFFSHVHPDRARTARDLGCSRVLPRSAFVQELPSLLRAPAEGVA